MPLSAGLSWLFYDSPSSKFVHVIIASVHQRVLLCCHTNPHKNLSLEIPSVSEITCSIFQGDYLHNLIHIKNDSIIRRRKVVILMASEKMFYLWKRLLNWVEIGRIGWQVFDSDTWAFYQCYSCPNLSNFSPNWSASSRISLPWWMCTLSITKTLRGPGYAEHFGSCER